MPTLNTFRDLLDGVATLYSFDADPSVVSIGFDADIGSVLIRTDVTGLYFKRIAGALNWSLIGQNGPNEFLGALQTPGVAATTGVLNIPARDLLIVQMEVQFYGAPGTVGLRFNEDNGAHYYNRFLTAAPGGAVLVNHEFQGGTVLLSAGVDTTLNRSVQYAITNLPGSGEKAAAINTFAGTFDAGAPR